MFGLHNIEVTALVAFTGDENIPELGIHYLNLAELTRDPTTITGAIENHLAEHTGDSPTVTVDTSDPETVTYTAPGYRISVDLHSHGLEPKITCEQWGIKDVADYLSAKPATVRGYLSRNQMPDPDGFIAGSPWWDADRIRSWERPRKRG